LSFSGIVRNETKSDPGDIISSSIRFLHGHFFSFKISGTKGDNSSWLIIILIQVGTSNL
jgi:hypothetical protein